MKITRYKNAVSLIIIITSICVVCHFLRQPLISFFDRVPSFGSQIKSGLTFNKAENIINFSIPRMEFVGKKDNKRNDLKDELVTLRKYILGIDNTKARDIIEVEFGINRRKNVAYEKLEKTNVEGISSIFCNNETDEREIKQSKVLTSGKITITNETNYKIDIDSLLKEPLKRKFKRSDEILIYHTHTNESYISDISKLNDMSVPQRSKDENINVIRVGDELKNNLQNLNQKAIHNMKYHNVPNDKGAYARSLNTVEDCIKNDSNIAVTLDIHRDGISDRRKLRMVEKIDNKNVAKIMFVVGTNATGLKHNEWKENLKFALKLQEKLIGYNANMAKPIFVSKNRYNQHLTNSSLIIEIGGDGNLVTESIESTKYIARALSEVISENLEQ